jgi:hypothetical protein
MVLYFALAALPKMRRSTRLLTQYSAVGIVTSLSAGRSGVSIPGETRDFYLLQNLHIDSGVQTALLPAHYVQRMYDTYTPFYVLCLSKILVYHVTTLSEPNRIGINRY